jgi:hypothetical protein
LMELVGETHIPSDLPICRRLMVAAALIASQYGKPASNRRSASVDIARIFAVVPALR